MQDTVRGLQFTVRVRGPRDGAPVLLLHGFPQNSGMWDRMASILHEAGLRTIAPDQRGYSPGARPAEVAAYRISEGAADAVALLDAVGVDSAHIVGHDFGALVGWRLAAACPDRVRTFTALSVPHPAAVVAAARKDPDQQQRSAYIKLFQEAGKAETLLLERGAARLRAMFGNLPPDRVDSYVRPLLEPGALTAALNWYRALGADSPTGPAVRPTTFVWGDRDVAIGPTAAHGCGPWVDADYEFVPLVGASHWLADEVPVELARVVLARVAVAGAGG
ncbi:MAG TPA: alpha/beta hydrolase [Actinomycetes bacterium]|nr:alpha/beta hydrolase [Actinomycetes bacterium]